MERQLCLAVVQKVLGESLWPSAARRDTALVDELHVCGSYVERKKEYDRPPSIWQVHQM